MTALKDDFSFDYDRIGVLYDYVGDTFLERHIRELYTKHESEFVYLRNKEFNAKDLYDNLKQRIKNGESIPPKKDRMVFCHYLNLIDLNNEWVDRFFKQAKKMHEFVPYDNLSDQYHLICFRLKAKEIPDEKVDDYTQLLMKLGMEQSDVARQIYIIREQGLADNQIRKQEYGIAHMFHMCSRAGHNLLQPIRPTVECTIHLISYTDYYEDQQRECNEQLKKVEHWLTNKTDPRQNKIKKAILEICTTMNEKLRCKERELVEKSSVYPVRITEYIGNCFTGYKRNEGFINQRLSSLQKGELGNEIKEIEEATDFSPVLNTINDYCYPDLVSLQKSIELGTIKAELKKDDSFRNIEEVIEAAYNRFLKEIANGLDNLSEQKTDKENDKKQLIVLLNEAGLFNSLEDCFKRINNETRTGSFKGIPLSCQFSACFVNGPFVADWDMDRRNIEEESFVYSYPPINPLQVVMLIVYDYLTFKSEDDKSAENSVTDKIGLLF